LAGFFRKPPDMSRVSAWLAVLVGFQATMGILLLIVYAWHEKDARIFATGYLVALATTAVAAVAGFLFGLPRYNPVVASPARSPADSSMPAMTAGDEARAAGVYSPSNNLEQISDWFTKLLLGAGLVQLGHVGRWLGDFITGIAGAFVSDNAGSPPVVAQVVAGSLVAFYAAFGFLFGYIITTLWYRRRLEALIKARRAAGDEPHEPR
jgi:hypothetical protein